MEKFDIGCADKNCNVSEAFLRLQQELAKGREEQAKNQEDTKADFAKFEKKQDQILDVLSDYKVLLAEIKNLKGAQERLEEQLIRQDTKIRESDIAIFQRLNELERLKADKTDSDQNRGWLWGLALVALSVLANFLVDMFKSHVGK